LGIRNRFLLTTGVLTAVTVAAVGVGSYQLSRQAALRDAKEKGRIIFKTMEGIQNNFMAAQRPLLGKLVEKERFYPELMSGAVITRMVWDQLAQGLPGYQFKQAAMDPRWEPNRADANEIQIIHAFRADAALKSQEGQVGREGEPFYYYATPRNTGKGCLTCHSEPETAPKDQVSIYGADRAYHWKEGEVNAAFVVYVPLGPALDEARTSALWLLAVAGAGLLLALLANWVLLDRAVVRPIVALSLRTDEISMGRRLDEKIPVTGDGEIRTLTHAVERLRVTIAKMLKRSAA
jgi:hypothetical protein